jgi:HAD superfamily hydrolase (TIGR01509 family)
MAVVLFDCDGVLVNTEQLVGKAAREVLSAHGLIYSEQQYDDLFLGSSMDNFRKQVRADWLDRTGTPIPETIFDEALTRYLQQEAAYIKEIAGVRDFVEALERSKVPFIICSNSFKASIERKLKHVGLFSHFDGKILSRESVTNGKPAPDIYQLGMQTLGETDPQKCLVIEDSPVGAAAGHAAGARVLGYTGASKTPNVYAQKLVKAGACFTAPSMAALAFEAFDLIDMIDQGPNWRNAPVRNTRGGPGDPTPA